MTKSIEQHYIPRVYLKNFQIDTSLNKSFVWCVDFSNKYKKEPQRLGLNDKVFKKRKYYNDSRNENSYAIEEALAKVFEPRFEKIMQEIKSEELPNKETVEDIMVWLYISKMRSPYMRDTPEQMLSWLIKVTNHYRGHIPDEIESKDIDDYISKKSKEVHLDAFTGNANQLLETYMSTLNAKHWRIIKSLPSFPFWTNDNPGFSPNLHPALSRNDPFHHIMELNGQSIIYYVLSPEYCLEITPFKKGTPLSLCALNMEIKFDQASPFVIDYINKGVYYTKYNLIISNSKQLLIDCLKPKEK